jgi:hypothetical protein
LSNNYFLSPILFPCFGSPFFYCLPAPLVVVAAVVVAAAAAVGVGMVADADAATAAAVLILRARRPDWWQNMTCTQNGGIALTWLYIIYLGLGTCLIPFGQTLDQILPQRFYAPQFPGICL